MRKRNHAIYIRMTTDEYIKLQSKVKQSGLSLQAFMINAALEGRVATLDELNALRDHCKWLEDIDKQLRGIGTNVNQLAHVANGQGIIPSGTELKNLAGTVEDIGKESEKVWRSIRSSISRQRLTEQ